MKNKRIAFECGTKVESLTTWGDGTSQFQSLLRTRRESGCHLNEDSYDDLGVCTLRAMNSPSGIGGPPFPLDRDSGNDGKLNKEAANCA